MSESGNLPSSTLVSCRQSTSGVDAAATSRSTRSMRRRTELMFQVVTVNSHGAAAWPIGAQPRSGRRQSSSSWSSERVADAHLSAVAAVIDRHGEGRGCRRASSPAPACRCPWPSPRGRRALRHAPRAFRLRLGDRLRIAHRQPARDLISQRDELGVRDRQERPGVACRQLAAGDRTLDAVRQLEKTQRVGDMAAALADRFGEVVLRVAELARSAAHSRPPPRSR